MNTSLVFRLAQKVVFMTLRNTHIFACCEFTVYHKWDKLLPDVGCM